MVAHRVNERPSTSKFLELPFNIHSFANCSNRIKNKSVPYNSKRTNMLSAHNFVDQIYQDEQARDSVSYIHRNNLSNCPTGLRNRNSNWNHLFSPYWMSRKEVEKPISESGSVGSEQSNTDHGFESLNGKSSSSEEQLSKLSTQNEKDFNFGENNEMPTKNEMESDAEEHQISSHLNRQSSKVYSSPWLGVTSNSECSYSSGSESDSIVDESEYNSNSCTPKTVAIADKITCTIWQHNEMKKAEMSLQDISSVITNKVESMTDSSNYMYIGLSLSVLLACVPIFSRLCEIALSPATNKFNPTILLENASLSRSTIIKATFGETFWEFLLLTISLLSRFCLTFMWFFMLAVAERTFKQRLLYAKLFSHLTSSRRAKKSEVPHFRLSKLRNIKLWLSIRSFLKKRGPQRSVDVIVSVTLILSIVLVSFLCAESLNDSVQQHWQYNLEVFVWSCSLGCFILRFMTLGTATNAKYRSVSILITEQINLYLKMEQNPEKKQKFSSANNVLKLAADLLKIISLFVISGGATLQVMLKDHFHILQYANASSPETLSSLYIVTGCLLLAASVFGIVAALKESTCMTNLYGVFLVLILILQISAAVTGFSLAMHVDLIWSDFILNLMYRYSYHSTTLDWIQKTFHCCGNWSPYDWSRVINFDQSTSFDGNMPRVPQSCCEYEYYWDPIKKTCPNFFTTGCNDALSAVITESVMMIASSSLVIAVLQILAIAVAFLYAKNIRLNKTNRDLQRWTQISQNMGFDRSANVNRNAARETQADA
ncbi:Protein phtf [Pseudolycoriella hygida]|uniref:Protein phtf n=1 Tax=Pseudolycoriella hygida TaxID=35572 RepID=A0A9Q0MUF7_9DIPT|nr:Protein phtf [Pseudolycoriella hygida]